MKFHEITTDFNAGKIKPTFIASPKVLALFESCEMPAPVVVLQWKFFRSKRHPARCNSQKTGENIREYVRPERGAGKLECRSE